MEIASQLDVTYLTPSQPRQLRLDTTTYCNARCVSCHRFLSKRKGQMDRKLLKKIIDDVNTWSDPLVEIVPVNYGEFFSNKDWEQILDVCCTTKAQIVIPTNGALLDEKKASRLCSFPNVKVINFSVNAYFTETYVWFNYLPATNIKNIENVINVIKVERPDIQIRTSMVFDPEYQTDLERDYFKDKWKEYAAVIPAASCGRNKIPFKPVITPCRSIFSDFRSGV